MLQLEISLGFIKQGETYLLQLRRDDPKLGASGMIGAFGGKVEADETPEQAVAREVSEETSLQVVPGDFEHLGEVEVISDFNLKEVRVVAHVYRTSIDAGTKLLAIEGEVVTIGLKNIVNYLNQFTPATKAVFKNIINEKV
jgi:8-oxo-dGTP pyrophosphatase MutT (NUDIX family)